MNSLLDSSYSRELASRLYPTASCTDTSISCDDQFEVNMLFNNDVPLVSRDYRCAPLH